MALLVAAAAVAAQPACVAGSGREDVAIAGLHTRLCEKARECGCGPLYYDGLGQPLECGVWSVDGSDDFGGFDRSTLAFDPACVERWTSWADELSCQVPARALYAELCPLYHGTLREGETCQRSGLVDTDCGAGLFCLAGTCRNPLRVTFGAQGEPCELGGLCDPDLECVNETCLRLPGPGEFCLEGFLCNAESRCGYDLCVALPGPGQRCDSGDCEPDAFCSFDPVSGVSECQRSSNVGEPCQGHRQCVSGNCPAGFCEEPAGVGDPCGSQLPCGPGLACVEDECRGPGEGVSSDLACEALAVLSSDGY